MRAPALLFVATAALWGGTLFGTGTAAADLLVLKDGRTVEGVVQLRKDDALVLSRFGTASIPHDQIVRHVKGPSVDQQVQKHLASLAADDATGRMHLARWLKKLGRTSEATALARQVLERDPEHAAAHRLLGHERFRGRWMTPDDAQRARGLEKHGDRWYTPAEWKLADPAHKARALADEAIARKAAQDRQLARLMELLVSPDPALRARARKALRALAKERGLPKERVDEALKAAAAYVLRLDEALTKAGTLSAGGSGIRGTKLDRHGWMLADVHDDFVRLKRPIREFATTLASSPAPVRIQLPEVRVVQVRTTTAVPVMGLTPSR